MQLTITDAGILAIADAESAGVKIKITEFAIGSEYGYTPERSQTALKGVERHRGAPINFRIDAAGQVTYVCRLEADVGTFRFGEIALYLENGSLFAIGTSKVLVYKTATVGNVSGNIIDIEASIFFDRIGQVVNFPTVQTTTAQLLTVNTINDLVNPTMMTCNAYMSKDVDDYNQPIYALAPSSINYWTFPSHPYPLIKDGIVSASSDLSISSAQIGTLIETGVIEKGKYIIQFVTGSLIGQSRLITSASYSSNVATVFWDEAFPQSVPINSRFYVYRSLSSTLSEGIPATVYIGDAAPSLPHHGGLWWESDSGNLWLRFTDANSSQWICIGNSQTPFNTQNFLSVTGGTTTGTISAPRIGIGTSVPSELLQLAATSSAVKVKLTNTSNATGGYLSLSTAGEVSIDNSAADKGITFNIGNTGKARITSSAFVPTVSNSISLGSASLKFTAVYAVNGVIQTSDRSLKKDIEDCDLGLNFILRLRPRKGRYLEEAEDSAFHYFLVTQEVEEALETPFAGLLKSEAGLGSLNYSEFVSPVIRAIQQQQDQVTDVQLEAETLKLQCGHLQDQLANLQSEIEELKLKLSQ